MVWFSRFCLGMTLVAVLIIGICSGFLAVSAGMRCFYGYAAL
ncbi:hypothetical protein [Thalassospira australica]